MIERLIIRNLALLESADLFPDQGLTVFTGETGAGKSLMISALDLVSGGRASKDAVRKGAAAAMVEAVFSYAAVLLPLSLQSELLADGLVELDEDGLFPDELILAREVGASGKNYCRLNGRLLTQQRLREVGRHLLDIQTQRDQASLYDVKTHLTLLDRFAGEQVLSKLRIYQDVLHERKRMEEERRALGGDPAQRARELDLLSYQINEIEKIAARPDEDEKLRKHRALQQNAAKISQNLDFCEELLDADLEASLPSLLNQLQSRIDAVAAMDERWQAQAERSTVIQEALSELADSLQRQRVLIDYRPDLLEKIDTRLNTLADLKRKYGPDLADVEIFEQNAVARKAALEAAEERLKALDSALSDNLARLEKAGQDLSEARHKAGDELSRAIEQELLSLGMKEAKFSVSIERSPHFMSHGRDELQFLIASNPGEGFKPLAKIASGGESARILLAVKLILTSGHPNASLVFDEIDSGVSGQTCSLIGQKLQGLARENQVFCVTHSAQIAACGHAHVLIEKTSKEGRTFTNLQPLSFEERKDELARLLSGEKATGAAAEVVEQLLQRSGEFEQSLS